MAEIEWRAACYAPKDGSVIIVPYNDWSGVMPLFWYDGSLGAGWYDASDGQMWSDETKFVAWIPAPKTDNWPFKDGVGPFALALDAKPQIE